MFFPREGGAVVIIVSDLEVPARRLRAFLRVPQLATALGPGVLVGLLDRLELRIYLFLRSREALGVRPDSASGNTGVASITDVDMHDVGCRRGHRAKRRA